ncbi:MAG TPA: hypothetical protein VME92_09575 [Acetobacteraceae bacterium]|nr:hypothetical protein [Acetobacteraceae bacterium]
MRHTIFRHLGRAGLILAGLVAASGPAVAMRSCRGALDTSTMVVLPRHLAVSLQLQPVTHTAQADQAVAAFASGLEAAGVSVDPQSTLRLSMALSIYPPTIPGTNQPASTGNFSDFHWMGTTASLPGGSPLGAKLDAAVLVLDSVGAQFAWIASISCTVETDDGLALARDIGYRVGQAMGRNIDQGTF